MALLNYTTTVSVDKSVAGVTKLLRDAGASSITVDYDADGDPIGLAFVIDTARGRRRFDLPVDVEAVLAVLVRQRLQPRYCTAEHAERVAWRILKDWLEAQLALITVEMVTLDQVLLPYMVTDELGTTVFELYQSGAAKALEA